MKKLQFKIKDLTDPKKLSSHDIKNIRGGSDEGCSSDICGAIVTCNNQYGMQLYHGPIANCHSGTVVDLCHGMLLFDLYRSFCVTSSDPSCS